MRIREAARQLGISPATVRAHIKDGSLPATRVEDARVVPVGWCYEIEPADVEGNRGRWKGRGRTVAGLDNWKRPQPDVIDVRAALEELPFPTPEPSVRARRSSGKHGAAGTRHAEVSWAWAVALGALAALAPPVQDLPRILERRRTPEQPPPRIDPNDLVLDPVTFQWKLTNGH
jgi:hypothetical protein